MKFRNWIEEFPLPPGKIAIISAALLAFLVFLTTIQVTANGSAHPYTTDVGEIQNALPRWGTIHFPGYPLYSLTGSAFVTMLRLVGIAPAAGASLFSALWGAVAVGLLVTLDLQFDVPMPAAVVTALLFALSTSFWVDASLAEVHTMTVALMLASLLFALRFSRHGRRSDLVWLFLFASQMVLHQRAMIFVGLGLLILALRQREALWRGLPAGLLVALLGSLIYLYLPIRDWQGADWTFSQPGTAQGFQALLFDTKTERIITMPESLSEWLVQARNVSDVLSLEWPLLLLALGLGGNVVIGLKRGWLEALAILSLWLPYVLLALVVREGRSSDAVLAAILPVVLMAGLGLAVLTAEVLRRWRVVGTALMVVWLAVVILLFASSRPTVLAITRDPGAQEPVAMAEQIRPQDGDQPLTLMALWGHDFWALAYAQAYEGLLPDTKLVDHNADLLAIMKGGRLLTLSRTFYLRPLSWWDDQFGRVYLAAYSPDLVELALEPPLRPDDVDAGTDFALGNGVSVRQAELDWLAPDTLELVVYWEAEEVGLADYSVAVHLVSAVPPAGPDDIVDQADSAHPVGGWYPTSRWSAGEIVRDVYHLNILDGATPEAVRLSMYQVDGEGEFVNSEWLTLPLPTR